MIYFAGPLSRDKDFNENREAVQRLRQNGFKVFLPQETGRNATTVTPNPSMQRVAFCKGDVSAMNVCSCAVARLPRECSVGTAFELGYMYAQDKPIIIWNEAGLKDEEIGTMLLGTCSIFIEFDAMMEFLRKLNQ